MNRSHWISGFIGMGLGWCFLVFIIFNNYKIQTLIKEKIIGIEYNTNINFSQDSLVNYIKELNIKFPHIVLAQAQIETGNFTSNIFKENHNLFGMREAKQRATTSKGTKRGHAHFDTWKNSVLDYALFQCRFTSKLSESEYYNYLGENYAEDSTYVLKIKKQANKNKKYF